MKKKTSGLHGEERHSASDSREAADCKLDCKKWKYSPPGAGAFRFEWAFYTPSLRKKNGCPCLIWEKARTAVGGIHFLYSKEHANPAEKRHNHSYMLILFDL